MKLEHMVSLIFKILTAQLTILFQKTLNEEEFRRRVYEFDNKRKRKIEQMQQENADKDLEGCTFQPTIYSVEEGYQKRNLDQFLEDQNNFVRKITKKIEDQKVKASIQEDSAMHPQIDETSRKIVEEKLGDIRYNKPIHERLYELNKEILDKKEMQRYMEMEKFRAQASQILEGGGSAKKRENLEQILYDDAIKRRQDQKKAKEQLDKVRDRPDTKPYHNEKSEKYVKKRFERELRLVQEEIVLGKQLKRENEYNV